MIRDTIDFFKKEKAYAILLGIVAVLYAVILWRPVSHQGNSEPSNAAVEKFRRAETLKEIHFEFGIKRVQYAMGNDAVMARP